MSEIAVWCKSIERVLAEFEAAPLGLSSDEAERRYAACGPNDPAEQKKTPAWLRFLGRCGNPLVIILLFASAISAVTGDVTSFIIVVGIVLLSVTMDFVHERRAEDALASLREKVALRACVIRDGKETALPVRQLVPGEVVKLIASALAAKPPPKAFEVGVPPFGEFLLRIAVVLILFVLAESIAFSRPWLESVLFALTLAVGLTPELLPMILTVTFARGAVPFKPIIEGN